MNLSRNPHVHVGPQDSPGRMGPGTRSRDHETDSSAGISPWNGGTCHWTVLPGVVVAQMLNGNCMLDSEKISNENVKVKDESWVVQWKTAEQLPTTYLKMCHCNINKFRVYNS
ncbi:hypothetical protein P7K49_027972 [Saguinus oedipus]|uniref:Uncharacterized protein n=1 Tax=Saguinus oedipus TaxID=9490 RepID=A0ABQ9UAX6_SAGOE|nr:hypothetical protein P7K49_027972 [Saguinus oedipus]